MALMEDIGRAATQITRGGERATAGVLGGMASKREQDRLEFQDLQRQLDNAHRDKMTQLNSLSTVFQYQSPSQQAGTMKKMWELSGQTGEPDVSKLDDFGGFLDRMAKMKKAKVSDKEISSLFSQEISEFAGVPGLAPGVAAARAEFALPEEAAVAGVSEVQSSEMLPSGLVQIVRKDGSTELVRPQDADRMLIEQAELRKAELSGLGSGERAAARKSIDMSVDAFKKLSPIRTSIANIDEGIRLLDEGAETGVVAARLPSVRAASVKLDNLQGKMGLDVISNTTFGALSESELKFALDTALPKKLEGPELRDWLSRKRDVQNKLHGYLEESAIYLGTPGNSIAGFLQERREGRAEPSMQPTPAPAAQGIPVGTVEDGYRFIGGDPAQQSSWEAVR